MEWIKIILPLVGVIIGWILSERGKIFSDKRQDKRKLKKLLFFLLELRFCFTKAISDKGALETLMPVFKARLALKLNIDIHDPDYNTEFDTQLNAYKPIFLNLFSQLSQQEDKFDYLSENIDKMLIELAEVFPILAYELNGQHNIKQQLNNASEYFKKIEEMAGENPHELEQLFNPKLTKDLLDDLDDSIDKIAKKIDKETFTSAKEKIAKMKPDTYDNNAEAMFDEYLNTMLGSIGQNN